MNNPGFIQVVTGLEPGWEAHAENALESRKNFVIVLPKVETELFRLRQLLGASRKIPEKMGRWAIHALREVIAPSHYKWLLDVYKDTDVRFVEQLFLSRNAPPLLKEYMLYCEVRGIIRDVDDIEEAGHHLFDYFNLFRMAQAFPLAGIYHWEGLSWVKLKPVSAPVFAARVA